MYLNPAAAAVERAFSVAMICWCVIDRPWRMVGVSEKAPKQAQCSVLAQKARQGAGTSFTLCRCFSCPTTTWCSTAQAPTHPARENGVKSGIGIGDVRVVRGLGPSADSAEILMAGHAQIVLLELGAYVRVGTEDGVMNPFHEWPCAVMETVTEKAERAA